MCIQAEESRGVASRVQGCQPPLQLVRRGRRHKEARRLSAGGRKQKHGDEYELDFLDEVEVEGKPDYYNAHMGFASRLAGLQAWLGGDEVI